MRNRKESLVFHEAKNFVDSRGRSLAGSLARDLYHIKIRKETGAAKEIKTSVIDQKKSEQRSLLTVGKDIAS